MELRGIPTVLITVSPEVSRQMRPPRAICPKDFKIGNSLGGPGMADLHRKVLWDAIQQVAGPARPGEVIEIEY
ncbi:MAG: hypothetical protein IPM55_15490 [Acidobacteria bacterium]|nr:hypothetical protein [Acidobacteriota bacterium]